MVDFVEPVTVFVDVNGFSVVVVFGSYVDADNGVLYGLLGVSVDGVFVLFVVQPLNVSVNVGHGLVFHFVSNWLNNSVVKGDHVVAEVGDEVTEFNLFDGDSWEDDVVVLVCGKTLLVVVEEFHDFAVELVEHWVTKSGLSKFEGRWCVFVDVVEFGSISKELSGDVLE